jgi:hypothetical protein
MKKISNLVAGAAAVAGLVSFGPAAFAEEGFELVKVDSADVFIPEGFDDNDESVVVLDGFLRSGCYKLAQSEHRLDQQTGVITVTQYARKYPGPCVMALVPFTSEVRLGVLPQGQYQVVTNDGLLSQRMTIKESNAAGPDDFMYAPVEAVTVHEITVQDNGDYVAFLNGRFTTNCMAWDGTKVSGNGKTIVVQPVIKMLDLQVCEDATIPFRVAVDLPRDMVDGRHLLHTRSLNGRSVNTMFSVIK